MYFHELTPDQRKSYFGKWEEVLKNHKKPDWCTFEIPLEYMFGCFSLVNGNVIDENSCVLCEYCKTNILEFS
jgi:hypothetical protein